MDFETQELIKDFREKFYEEVRGDFYLKRDRCGDFLGFHKLNGRQSLSLNVILLKRIDEHFKRLEDKEGF